MPAKKSRRTYSKKKTSSRGSKSSSKRKKLPLKAFQKSIGKLFQTKELVEDEVDTSSKAKGRRAGL